MTKDVTKEEFLTALDIVETYMNQVQQERSRIIEEKWNTQSLEKFMDTMEPSKRLHNALINYQDKWGINPLIEEMTGKKLKRTRGMGKVTKAEFLILREEFLKNV
jgi:hypothetical protein